MDDLVQFLRDRYDEEATEAQAAASKLGGGKWEAVLDPEDMTGVCGRFEPGDISYPNRPVIVAPEFHDTSVHIARHDPARVLREIDAKRAMVDHVARELDATDTPWWYNDKLTPILKSLALPYADHPDYQDDWRP